MNKNNLLAKSKKQLTLKDTMTSRREEHEAYLERILSNSLSSANPSKETFQRAQKNSFTYYNIGISKVEVPQSVIDEATANGVVD